MEATAAVARTDLHTHILPAVDDGAADLAEAAAMARAALDDGIVRLAATPHNLRWPPGTDRAALEARVGELERYLAAQGLPLAVAAGAEMALIPALPQQIDAGEFVTLNRSRYLLLELPYVGLPPRWEEIIFAVQVRGYVPILAHPERNADLGRHPDRLPGLVEQGLLLQITAGSLEGRFGGPAQRMMRHLLEADLVHAIASDAHGAQDRAPRLSQAQALAARIVGAERARALVATNPARILADLPLEVQPPSPPRRRWFWRQR